MKREEDEMEVKKQFVYIEVFLPYPSGKKDSQSRLQRLEII